MRITQDDLNKERFYMVPKELFLAEAYRNLSSNDKLVYSILKDRLHLSKKNDWINEKRELYLKFKREKLAALMSVTRKTVSKCIEQLKKVGLIEEERVARGNVNLIYICHMKTFTDKQLALLESVFEEDDLEAIEDYSEEHDPQTIDNALMGKKYPRPWVKSTHEHGYKLPIKIQPHEPTMVQGTSHKFSPIETTISETTFSDTTTTEQELNTKKIVVVAEEKKNEIQDEKTKQIKQKIDSTLGANISIKATNKLLTECGEEPINKCLNDWDKFKTSVTKTAVGFFINAVQEGYSVPKAESIMGNMSNMNNFEQRSFAKGEYDKYYYKIPCEV